MEIYNFYETKEEAREVAKTFAKSGKLVEVSYNDYFQEFQINIYEKDEDGILI